MRVVKSIFSVFYIFAITVFIAFSCESDPDELGKQFLTNTAVIDELGVDVIAYNVDNNDSIRSDNKVLGSVLLGAFNEPVFGMRKASYVTQLIPNDFNRNFGKNPTVDSVILQIVPKYKQDSVETTSKQIKIAPSDVNYLKTISKYPLDVYGKRKINNDTTKLTIRVAEIGNFIGSSSSKIYSEKNVDEIAFLGEEKISTRIEATRITNANEAGAEISNKVAAIYIKLDTNFFKTKIVDKQGQSEISDLASFIRYFKGIRISVVENDGFLFYFNPNKVSLTMYYSYDDTASDKTVTRKSTNLTFNLGANNARFSQFKFTRPSDYKSAMEGINTSTGDTKLYLQGSGGSGAEFVIPDSEIKNLRDRYRNDKIGILSAKIRLYNEVATWSNNFDKPSSFTILRKGENKFMDDLIILSKAGFSQINAQDLNKNSAYYDLDITQTLKNLVEKGADNKPITINVGNFEVTPKGEFTGWENTTRAYTPNRIVLVGSDPSSDKRVQLKIIYAKK